MIAGHVAMLLTGSLFSTTRRRGQGKRVVVSSESQRRDERTLDGVIEFLCSVQSLVASDIPRGRTHGFPVRCENCPLCRFVLHW
jgi:hypothetical protein